MGCARGGGRGGALPALPPSTASSAMPWRGSMWRRAADGGAAAAPAVLARPPPALASIVVPAAAAAAVAGVDDVPPRARRVPRRPPPRGRGCHFRGRRHTSGRRTASPPTINVGALSELDRPAHVPALPLPARWGTASNRVSCRARRITAPRRVFSHLCSQLVFVSRDRLRLNYV